MIDGDRYWEEQASELRRTGLTRLRAQAEKWQTTITALLGVFGTVALFEAPGKLSDLTTAQAGLLVLASIVAAILAILAIRNSADAAQGLPGDFESIAGPGLEVWNYEEAGRTRRRLSNSRGYSTAAVVVLLVGSAAAWLVGIPSGKTSDQLKIVAVTNGQVVCGSLVRSGDVFKLKLGSGTEINLANVTLVQIATACP